MANNSAQSILLNQSELSYLVSLTGAKAVVGMSNEQLQMTQTAETVVEHLRQKHILGTGNGSAAVAADYKPWIEALLAPTRALLAIRELPNVGRQALIFSSRGAATVLHSQPSAGEHNIARMTTGQISQMLDSWFPSGSYPEVQTTGFQATSESLERARDLIESGQVEAGIKAVQGPGLPPEAVSSWAEALRNRKYTGSFAFLLIDGDEVRDAESFSIIAGQESAWLVLSGTAADTLQIVRANRHCRDRILYAVQSLIDVNAQQFTSLALPADGLAYAFAAINRADLGARLLQSTSGMPLDEAQLSARMQSGAEALARLGLCIASPTGAPVLNPTLEKVIFPLALFDWMVRATIQRPDKQTQASIFVQSRRSFTSQLVAQDTHVLELGSAELLASYLDKLYADFAAATKPAAGKPFALGLGLLRRMLSDASQDFKQMLAEAGVPAAALSTLEHDLRHQAFNGWVTRINAGSRSDEQAARQMPQPTLFLMQSVEHAWVFSFPADGDDSQGTAQMVDRRSFGQILSGFLRE